MSSDREIHEDQRIPPDAYKQGHRVRTMTHGELVARGFSEAEAWSLYYGQYQSYRCPIANVIENVVINKTMDGKPYTPLEQAHVDSKLADLRARIAAKAARL